MRGQVPLFCAGGGEQRMRVDKAWLYALLERNPLKLMREQHVPVLANQWGVKRSVSVERGRLRYAEDVATLFEQMGIHSALWIWRSYRKDTWGFELCVRARLPRVRAQSAARRAYLAVWVRGERRVCLSASRVPQRTPTCAPTHTCTPTGTGPGAGIPAPVRYRCTPRLAHALTGLHTVRVVGHSPSQRSRGCASP